MVVHEDVGEYGEVVGFSSFINSLGKKMVDSIIKQIFSSMEG